MKQRKGSSRRKPAKSPPLAKKNEEPAVINTEHLLEEVEEANEHIADPKERERVIPSRPC